MRKFVQSRTMARLKKLEAELRRAVHAPEDQKAIHDLRVAIRRFTQCIRTFAQFLDPARIKPFRRRLRKLMDRCGAARNCDIALEVLRAAGLHDREISAELAGQRRRARKELAQRLRSRHHRMMTRARLVHLHQASGEEDGVWDLKKSAAENARRVLPSLAEELFAAGDVAAMAGSGYLKLHGFRLQVKRFRYTFELFQPVYHAGMKRGLAMLRGLQDKLGAISDCGATLKIVKHDRRAAAAVRKLLSSREAEFREYWAGHCGPPVREWWKSTLAKEE
jgi:CHAD domain-containing protein